MKSKLLGALCVAVLCVILTLGLWPFHAPKNDVTWLKRASGVSFGRYGTVQSSGVLKTTSPGSGLCGSIEVWVQPDRWTGGTILAFYEPESRRLFELQQSLSDLKLETEVHNDEQPNDKGEPVRGRRIPASIAGEEAHLRNRHVWSRRNKSIP